MLAQQHVIATPDNLVHRVLTAGPHPERRMGLLRGRRLDDDIVELPVLAPVRERRFRGESLGDDLKRFLEARVSLLQGYAEPGEFIVPVALADPEIEPAAGQQIKGCRLLCQQHWVVPGQYEHRRAEAQMPRAGSQPSQ